MFFYIRYNIQISFEANVHTIFVRGNNIMILGLRCLFFKLWVFLILKHIVSFIKIGFKMEFERFMIQNLYKHLYNYNFNNYLYCF